MEDFIINSVLEAAREAGIETINAEYIPTPKNKMVENIYSDMGFEALGDGKFTAKVNEYKMKNVWIEKR